MTYVVGIDVGSQSVKAVLVDESGATRATASAPCDTHYPASGWAEHDPRRWEHAITQSVRQLRTAAGVGRDDVTMLALACQVDGLVALDANLRPLRPAIIWLDRRADAQASAMADLVGAQRLFDITGLVPDASHSGPKILWLRDHEPETFASASAFPPVAGYLLKRLTDRLALDHANASSSMLYDLRARRWSSELLGAFDLREDQLGEILAASDSAGVLSARAADATGLSTSCAVMVGTGDEHAASIGAGAISEGIITDVTGTAEPVTVASAQLVLDREMLVETHAHALHGFYLVENPGFVSGGST